MIKSKELKFKYDEQFVLNGINVEIKEGEYICIIGNNGGGKSTFALHLNGILTPSSGAIYIDNIDTSNEEIVFEVRKNVGIVFQNPDNQIISSVVEEDVAFGPNNLKENPEEIEKVIEQVLQDVDLNGYEKHYTNKLSGGQKQRLAIAGILAMKPKYLILDESTSMLDKQGAKQVLQIVKELNEKHHITIIHITHTMEEVTLANRVIVFYNGKIVLDNKPLEIFKNINLLKEIGLDLPLPTELIYELKEAGIKIENDAQVLTCDECAEAIVKMLKSER